MLTYLDNILDKAKLANIRNILDNAVFIDGKLSAGKAAKGIKNNEELDQSSKQAEYLDHLVIGSLAENANFRNAALPLRVSQPFFARYTNGMGYGDHIDDPVMGGAGQRYRCDIAVTVFLNEPDEYDGGELTINTSYGQQKVKLNAGKAVMYPAASLHHVAQVSRGQRLVCVIWLQSMIRDPAKRELLYELNLARETLLDDRPDDELTAQVNRAYNNLVRMWSEV